MCRKKYACLVNVVILTREIHFFCAVRISNEKTKDYGQENFKRHYRLRDFCHYITGTFQAFRPKTACRSDGILYDSHCTLWRIFFLYCRHRHTVNRSNKRTETKFYSCCCHFRIRHFFTFQIRWSALDTASRHIPFRTSFSSGRDILSKSLYEALTVWVLIHS